MPESHISTDGTFKLLSYVYLAHIALVNFMPLYNHLV